MEFDVETLKDIQTMLSYVEGLVQTEFQEISEQKKQNVQEIMKHPERYCLDGDELMIHSQNPVLDAFGGDIKSDIPFEDIRTVDIIGDSSCGIYNAVYFDKKARFLFPNATKYLSSSSYFHWEAFKKALEERMKEEEESYETFWFGFAYGGDLYALEYVGESGLDLLCASHPFGNDSFRPLPLCLANIESPGIEGRYIKKLTIRGDGVSTLSAFRQGFYESGVECLLDECENLEELVIADDCPVKEEIVERAKERGIKIGVFSD